MDLRPNKGNIMIERERDPGTGPKGWRKEFQEIALDLLQQEEPARQAKLEELVLLGYRMIDDYEAKIKLLRKEISRQREELDLGQREKLQMRESIDELLTLQRLSETISSALHPDQILDSLVALTRKVVDLEDCGLFLLESNQGRIEPMFSQPSPYLERVVQFQLEEGIIDWVIGERKPTVIPDIETLSEAPGVPSRRSFIIIPLIVHNRGLGVFVVSTHKESYELTSQDLELLSLLASQAAIAMDNSRSYAELVAANEELKRSQAQLVQSAKMAAVGELAGGIAHEINNPLQVILSRVQLLLMQERTWSEVVQNLKAVEKEIHRIAAIVRGLLDFARQDQEGFRMLNVNEVVERTLLLIDHQLKLANIELTLNLERHLPYIYGNFNQLQQVFLNLIINAKQAMPNGGSLRVTTRRTRGWVEVEFLDTGVGIPEENLDKIFEPFFTTRKAGEGTGLGLSISYEIIRKHNGYIEVKSEANKGTTLIIKLSTKRMV